MGYELEREVSRKRMFDIFPSNSFRNGLSRGISNTRKLGIKVAAQVLSSEGVWFLHMYPIWKEKLNSEYGFEFRLKNCVRVLLSRRWKKSEGLYQYMGGSFKACFR